MIWWGLTHIFFFIFSTCFFLDLFFQICKTQWELVDCAVWGSVPPLVDHVLENQPSPEQKPQRPWAELPWAAALPSQAERGADRAFMFPVQQLAHEFLNGSALHNADLNHCSTFIINTFPEPVSYSSCWFYYSSIIHLLKQKQRNLQWWEGSWKSSVRFSHLWNDYLPPQWILAQCLFTMEVIPLGIASQQANILSVMGGSSEFIIVLPLTFHYIQDQNKHDLHASVRENFFSHPLSLHMKFLIMTPLCRYSLAFNDIFLCPRNRHFPFLEFISPFFFLPPSCFRENNKIAMCNWHNTNKEHRSKEFLVTQVSEDTDI